MFIRTTSGRVIDATDVKVCNDAFITLTGTERNRPSPRNRFRIFMTDVESISDIYPQPKQEEEVNPLTIVKCEIKNGIVHYTLQNGQNLSIPLIVLQLADINPQRLIGATLKRDEDPSEGVFQYVLNNL